MDEDLIYLDNNATTKIDPRVLEAMMPFLTNEYGNASSNHRLGVAINQHVKKGRNQIAELLRCDDNEIIFTSGATEAINLAIKGAVESNKEKGKEIVTVSTEHPAVLDTCKYLEKQGYKVTYLPVSSDGLVDLNSLKNHVTKQTILVSVMMVNNETGVIQDIQKIAEITHANGSIFMTDATQAIGKIDAFVNDLGVDLLSFSGHKFYGPKGIGGLYVRSKRPNKIRIDALIHGGGHERGLRSGTLNVPGIVGIGRAAQIAKEEMDFASSKIRNLRDYLEIELLKIENSSLNGHRNKRLYNVSNISFKGVNADAMIIGLQNILISNGSACSSSNIEPSHVLTAMGLSPDDCYSSLRFSLGKFNSKAQIGVLIKSLKEIINDLRLINA